MGRAHPGAHGAVLTQGALMRAQRMGGSRQRTLSASPARSSCQRTLVVAQRAAGAGELLGRRLPPPPRARGGPESPHVAIGSVQRQVAHEPRQHLGLREPIAGGVHDGLRTLGGVRGPAARDHLRVAEHPARGEHAPQPGLQAEAVLDDEVREIVRQLARRPADLVVAAAVELDHEPVAPMEDRAVAAALGLEELDLDRLHRAPLHPSTPPSPTSCRQIALFPRADWRARGHRVIVDRPSSTIGF